MSRTKTFTYAKFRKAVADQLPKSKHQYITHTAYRMGYLDRKEEYTPFLTVIYPLKPGVILTQEDVDKVVKAMQ